MGTIKDGNGMDLIEAEDIKKMQQEYTEELNKRDLNDRENHDGVITHLEPDILDCEVKWALGSITMNIASGGDEIPVELFQILKKRCYESAAFNMLANLENSAVATGLEKSLFHSNLKRRQCQKCFYYHTTALISHARKVMLKILQARLQQYINFQMFKLDLEKAEEPEIESPTSTGSWKKQDNSRKTSASLTTPRPLTA